jgi:hypothetical protein
MKDEKKKNERRGGDSKQRQRNRVRKGEGEVRGQ